MKAKSEKVLILSTGRTGTLFFARHLENKLASHQCFHESSYSRTFNILSNIVAAGLLPTTILRSTWKKLNKHKEFQKVLDSNNMLYLLPRILPDEFADYKIIHIHRSPFDYAKSHYNWSGGRLKSYIANNLTPFWQPNAFLLGEIDFKTWSGFSKLDKFLWVWKYKNQMIHEYKSSNQTLTVDFDKLFNNDKANQLIRIYDFLGIEWNENDVRHLSNKKNSSRTKGKDAEVNKAAVNKALLNECESFQKILLSSS